MAEVSLNFGLKKIKQRLAFLFKKEDTGAPQCLKPLSSRRGFCGLGHLPVLYSYSDVHVTLPSPHQLP